jgi:hypothetical protein
VTGCRKIISAVVVLAALVCGGLYYWIWPDYSKIYQERDTALEANPGAQAWAFKMKRQGASQSDVDAQARQKCRQMDHPFVALAAPRGYPYRDKLRDTLNEIGEVVYERNMVIQGDGRRNLLLNQYDFLCENPHGWVHRERKIWRHIRSRFNRPYPARVYLFSCPSREIAEQQKRKIRHESGLGTTFLHITDTPLEAVLLADLAFDEEKIQRLNTSKDPYVGLSVSGLSHCVH